MIDKNKDVELYELVKNIKHIITVKHVENMKIFHVDLNLDIFFTDTTIVAEPLPEDMDPQIKLTF